MYWPVFSSIRAFDWTWLTRPVRSAYRCCAAVSCAADAPGKFDALNIAIAGSEGRTSKFTVGTSIWFFDHSVYWVADAPIVKLCAPFSQVTLSSTSSAVAFRDDGVAPFAALVVALAPPGDVNWLLTDGNARVRPCMFAGLADHRLGSNCGLNSTGAPLQPRRASLTRFVVNVERTQLLNATRCDSWPPATGNPGNAGSRLFSVSGNVYGFW